MNDVLQAYFTEVNSRGGIYNRKVELRIMYGDPKATVANAKRLIDDDQVFAMVSGLIAGAEDGVAALTQEKEVPFVGPSTLLPQRALPLNRYIFYLLPGLKEQARALALFAAKKTDPSKLRAAIIARMNACTSCAWSEVWRWASFTSSRWCGHSNAAIAQPNWRGPWAS